MLDRDSYLESPSDVANILNSLFKKKSRLTIFEVGSCEGEDAIKYSRLFPNSMIYCFEPLPSNIVIIKNNLIKYEIQNIKIFEIALSNQKAELDFHVSSGRPDDIEADFNWDFGNKSSSLLKPYVHLQTTPWLNFSKPIRVKSDTIFNITKENNINSIDFIHIDAQGAELLILEGAETFLKKIKTIWLEVSDIELYDKQPLRTDIEKFMLHNKFYLFYSKMNGNVGDQFYINKSYFLQYLFFLYKKRFKNVFS